MEKTCTRANKELEQFAAKEIFVNYLELVVHLIDSPLKLSENVKTGRSLLRVIHSAGFKLYASLAVICLFAMTKKDQDIRLKDNLHLDCDLSSG